MLFLAVIVMEMIISFSLFACAETPLNVVPKFSSSSPLNDEDINDSASAGVCYPNLIVPSGRGNSGDNKYRLMERVRFLGRKWNGKYPSAVTSIRRENELLEIELTHNVNYKRQKEYPIWLTLPAPLRSLTLSAGDGDTVCKASNFSFMFPAADKETFKDGLKCQKVTVKPSEKEILTKNSLLRNLYDMRERFEGGSHGEIWRARRVTQQRKVTTKSKLKTETWLDSLSKLLGYRTEEEDNSKGDTFNKKSDNRYRYRKMEESFILKRMFVERGESVRLAGLREAHFGQKLRGLPHIARFVEYFETKKDIWLVFQDEGKSLRDFLYSRRNFGNGVGFESSEFWRALRTEADGLGVLQSLWYQIAQGVATLHKVDVTHRDIKPSNIIINIASDGDRAAVVKIADFSSAIDSHSLKHLYGKNGPSQFEETVEYQPPEVLFSNNGEEETELNQPYYSPDPKTYDLWTMGVTFLEMILGTQHVFAVSDRTFAKLEQKMRKEKRGEDERRKLLLLTGLAEWCVFPEPNSFKGERSTTPIPKDWELYSNRDNRHTYHRGINDDFDFKNAVIGEGSWCGLDAFNRTLRRRDPLEKGLGFESRWAVDLLWRLLRWEPMDRLPVEQVLKHAFFNGPYTCDENLSNLCKGKEFALPEERDLFFAAAIQTEMDETFGNKIPKVSKDGEVSDDACNASNLNVAVMNIKDEKKTKPVQPDEFCCSYCGRCFDSAKSCDRHVSAREHNKGDATAYCWTHSSNNKDWESADTFNSNVGDCNKKIRAHGWSGTPGRRGYGMEDFASAGCLQVDPSKPDEEAVGWFALFDGHRGSGAASWLAGIKNTDNICEHYKNNHGGLHSFVIDVLRKFHLVPGYSLGNGNQLEYGKGKKRDKIVQTRKRKLADSYALMKQSQNVLTLNAVQQHTGRLWWERELMEESMRIAFANADAELSLQSSSSMFGNSGSTATVVLIGEETILVANVGDSTAILCCDEEDKPVVLSQDHLPSHSEELRRIESLEGGYVDCPDKKNKFSICRVQGELAVSRSIGDPDLHPYVSSKPFTRQHNWTKQGLEDFVILGTDGLWEALSFQQAVTLVKDVRNGQRKGLNEAMSNEEIWDEAARALVEEAYYRLTSDNISALVVDLKSEPKALN
eukprot:g4327.t1